MARNSKGQYDRLVTLRLVTNGDPQFFDWEQILFGHNPDDETVQVVRVDDA